MKLTIDTDSLTLVTEDGGAARTLDLYSPEAFAVLSPQWLRVAWSQKYSYTFTWLGRPIIQLPEDLLRVQEVVYHVRPDVIVETGIAHGGSLIFYASLCQLMGIGRVVGVDIEIRPKNREAIEAHSLKPYITLIEGSSTDMATVEQVKALIRPGERVMVALDSHHTYDHVMAELRTYADLVSPESYLLVEDGVMIELADVPGAQPSWAHDNPASAARDFVAEHPEFEIEPPSWVFNESPLQQGITHWTSGWLKRRSG